MRISSDDRSLELPPSAWFSSSAEKHFFHFVIRAKPSCIPRANPSCIPRANPSCIPRAKPSCIPRAEPKCAPRAKPRGGTVTMMPPQWGYCTPSGAVHPERSRGVGLYTGFSSRLRSTNSLLVRSRFILRAKPRRHSSFHSAQSGLI